MLKVVKYNILFFLIGARLGASFRLMILDILKDIFIESFFKQTDIIRMRWKSDLRYWLRINIVYFPVKLFPLEPIQIPEEYVYIILARMMTKFKLEPNIIGEFEDWFEQNAKSLPIHPSTRNLMDIIILSVNRRKL
jgi:hypothetical protein